MATFDLGRVTPLYKGDYSASASYELNDVVLYNGNLYWHVQATATVGILPTDTTVWKLAFADEGVRAEIRGYADNAQNSADSASASKTAAAQSASQASTSASQAALSAQSAQTAESNAKEFEQAVSAKAAEASESAANAAESVTDAQAEVTRASAEADRAREEAEQAASRIYDFLPTDKANGSVASFEDGANNVPLKSLVVGINPVQEGSGDPSPTNVRPISGWTSMNVARCGKNILMNTAKPHTINHIIYNANADGSITANGTATPGNGRCDILNVNNPSKALLDAFSGKKLAGCPEGGANNTYLIQLVIDGTLICRDTGNGVNIPDLSQYYGATNLYIDASVRTNYTAENLVFKPMISDDASYGAYEPYSGNSIAVTFPSEAGTVYGGTLDVLTGVLTVTKGFIQSYNGEALLGAWISDRDVYVQGATPTTGAEVCYDLATPIVYQLTPTEVKSLLGQNTIYADTGDTSVEYRTDIQMWVEKKLSTRSTVSLTRSMPVQAEETNTELSE